MCLHCHIAEPKQKWFKEQNPLNGYLQDCFRKEGNSSLSQQVCVDDT